MGFNNNFNSSGGATVLTDLEVDGTTLSIDEVNNRVGIGTITPTELLTLSAESANLALQNTTVENGEGEAETSILFVDHSPTPLATIEGSHSGMADDTKGKLIISTHSGSSLNTAVTIDDTQKATFAGAVNADDSVSIKEKASANADVAAYGQLWVKTATPNELYFTTDAGDDIQLTTGTGTAGGGGGAAADTADTILHMQVFA